MKYTKEEDDAKYTDFCAGFRSVLKRDPVLGNDIDIDGCATKEECFERGQQEANCFIEIGSAKLTATTQYFLDTCPAVLDWTLADNQETATFRYDSSIEVVIAPKGVEF